MLIGTYIRPESDRSASINELIVLFDDPQQREAHTLAAEALEEAGEGMAKSVAGGHTPGESSERTGSAALFWLKVRRSL